MAKASFDPQEFRSALSTFTTGVTIITTRAENGDPVGITANSFNSVSLNPPMVLWSLDKSAMSLPAFTSNKHWNVHILSVEQEALSGRFASRGEDKFKGLELDTGINNIPLLKNCTARFNCRTAFIYEGGDHMIFVGEVLGFDKSERPPLAFQSGQYALAARKPREGVQLGATPPPECSYTEDLLGYLAGRAHFQLVAALQNVLKTQQLNEQQFFILSVLSIQDSLTIEEINTFVDYTGGAVTLEDMAALEEQDYVVLVKKNGSSRYVLTANGREASLKQIAVAKAVEEQIADQIGAGDVEALKILFKRLIKATDPGLPDLWATKEENDAKKTAS
ncbi:flavin reductase [Denitrificimonas sp. JX-1]|uniref:Flavin reductase n=1 Tax=Denitrificimonas halotolerans TaxID=3098930 RepID=A0ABU5GMG0_9GAMM|nr:flavin reductase [Denitrificimonas sp. JX-1]MDY7218063.1 flavin reductase [Denitrificimonas sp. JX-1]